MDWVGPWLGGGRSRDPFWDLLDPFGGGTSWGVDRRRGGGDDETTALANANVDWLETDTAHVFRADLPGVRKEDLKVQVENGNILQISGERVKEEEDKKDWWHRIERRRGSFVRRFRLPENSNLDEIKCNLENGVLTVVVPKKVTGEERKDVRYIDVA